MFREEDFLVNEHFILFENHNDIVTRLFDSIKVKDDIISI